MRKILPWLLAAGATAVAARIGYAVWVANSRPGEAEAIERMERVMDLLAKGAKTAQERVRGTTTS